MSYADQHANERIGTRSTERGQPSQVATYEIPTNQYKASCSTPTRDTAMDEKPQQQIMQTMVREPEEVADDDELASPDIPAPEQNMNEGPAGGMPVDDSINDSTATANMEQDSYMNNGADESGNVSVSDVSISNNNNNKGIPEGIVVRVHATTELDSSEISRIQDISQHASFPIKPDGKSYKYPELKKYYEFGPWVGRNRKAICVRCKHQSASSQPERLIKHMKRCPMLSDEDKSLADTLLLESSTNKRGRPSKDEPDYFGELDEPSMLMDEAKQVRLPPINVKRLKKCDVSDRKSQIDQALAKWIICCRIPLKSIHSKEFVEFVRALDPEYRLPSRETITNVLIPSLLNIL